MSSTDDKPKATSHSSAQQDRTPSGKSALAIAATGKSALPREQQMGDALRSVYQRAVDEKVPDDLMELLGKLG